MALSHALVDHARVLTQVAGTRVEGRTITSEAPGEWFRCRYEQTAGQQGADFAGQVVVRPKLLCGVRDIDGAKIRITSAQRLEVSCKALWDATRVFEVDGDPEALRKRRRLIGFEASLSIVLEHQLGGA